MQVHVEDLQGGRDFGNPFVTNAKLTCYKFKPRMEKDPSDS